MTNSILGVLMLLGLGGVLATMIVGIVMAAQRKWHGAVVCLVLFFVSLGLFGGMMAWWVVNAVHTVKSTIAAREATEMAREAKRAAARLDVKKLTPDVDWSQVDGEFWENDGVASRDRLPIRYPYEIDAIGDLESGTLHRNIANGKSQHPDTQLKPADVSDIVDFAVDADMLVYRSEDGLHKETWGIFLFGKDEKVEFTSAAAMWKEAKARGWTHPEELKSFEDRHAAYWYGM